MSPSQGERSARAALERASDVATLTSTSPGSVGAVNERKPLTRWFERHASSGPATSVSASRLTVRFCAMGTPGHRDAGPGGVGGAVVTEAVSTWSARRIGR